MSIETKFLRDANRAANRTEEIPHFVWLVTPLTSTSWDGDAKAAADDGIIDLSAVFGVPANAKAVLVRMTARDETAGVVISLSPTGTPQYALVVRTVVANAYDDASGWVPCDANGDIYFYIADEVDNLFLEIWGYIM